METVGTVVTLNTQFPREPNATSHLIVDFEKKIVSLVVVDPTNPNRIKVIEVQSYLEARL